MMNAYQRPLFRQAGGPAGLAALPPPPPAGVGALPPPNPQALVDAAGQRASSEMESVGRDYVSNMMESLDGSENFKQVIDSLRGNSLPLEERYDELSEYVGEEDAEKTPESVLAMVQPVIMMTEEGNVDSGIGQLMQSLAGDVDMVTEEGMPTDMGQGVGALMAANQEAPVQQFANGGPVQHFQDGKEVSPYGITSAWDRMPQGFRKAGETFSPNLDFEQNLKPFYEQRLGTYMGILDPEKERAMTKSQIMFDIAQAGLNFAGGIDPRTGQPMTRRPAGAQLAAAASGLPGQIGERIARQRQSEQAVKLAALGAAESQLTARETVTANERGAYIQALRDLNLSEAQIQSHLKGIEITEEGATTRTVMREEGLSERQERLFKDQEARDIRIAEIEEKLVKVRAEQGRITIREEADLVNKRDTLLQKHLEAEIDARAVAAKDVHAANTEITHGFTLIRQKQAEDFEAGYRNADRDQRGWIAEQNFEREDTALEIQRDAQTLREDMFEDAQERGLSTGGWLDWWDSDARNAAEAREVYDKRFRALTLRATEFDINRVGLADSISQYVQLGELNLRNRAQQLRETDFSYGVMRDQYMPGPPAEFTTNQMNALLGDDNAIRAYGAGAPMPRFEYALSQRYADSFDINTGMRITKEMGAGLQSAIAQRADLGLAVPLSTYLPGPQIQDLRSGYAQGGPVRHMANGGDPFVPDPSKGMWEPLTQRYLPRPSREEPISFADPIISDLSKTGVDITAGVGSDAWGLSKLGNIISAGGAIFGQDISVFPQTEEAERALDTFNSIALTRAMKSLAGRESAEVIKRLRALEVPAANFFYNDHKALAQFRASGRAMDLAVREQKSLMQGPGLTRTERNAARAELSNLEGLSSEYSLLADIFSRKLEGTTKDVSSQLDQFFN